MEQLITWQQVAGAFSKRYEHKRGMAWHYGPHVQHLTDVAEWVNMQDGDRRKIAARLLDNWFDLKWAMKVDYKPRFLAENLGSVYNPVAVPIEEEPDADAINARRLKERRQRDQRDMEAKFREQRGKACVPPPLEQLIGKIGKKI